MLRKNLPAFLSGLMFAAALLLVFSAFAQTSPPSPVAERLDPTVASELAETAIKIVAAILLCVITWAGRKAIVWFESKTKIDIPEKQEAMIEGWIKAGIALAEEKAWQKLKDKTSQLKGPEKLEVAGTFVWGLVQQHGLADWTRDKIVDKIEAKLGLDRMNGEHRGSQPDEA